MTRIIAVIAAICTVLAPNPSFAQNDQGAQNQVEEKKPGLVKRTIRSFFSDDKPEGGRGAHLGPFVPGVDIVSSGSALGPILHFWAPDIGGSPVDLHASAAYSIIKYQYYDLQLGLVPHDGDRLPPVETGTNAVFPLADLAKTAALPGFNIYASARYRDYPREDYYGIGASSAQSNHTDYRLQDGLYEGIVRFRVARLSLMGRAGVLQTSILPGTDSAFPNTEVGNNERTAPGLLRSPDFRHVSGAAWLEMRDQPGNTHRGVAVGAAVSRFDDRNGAAFAFRRFVIDAREFIPLGSHRHVIALRQVVSLDKPDAGSTVPFYMRPTLGGSLFLRGYNSSRFRDDRLLALAGEYRFEAHPRVELALLYEAGKVFPTASEFDFRNLRRSYGVGIRIKSPRKVHLRVDVLRGLEGTRVHVKLKPSF